MNREKLRELLREAFEEGFSASGEGFNGDYVAYEKIAKLSENYVNEFERRVMQEQEAEKQAINPHLQPFNQRVPPDVAMQAPTLDNLMQRLGNFPTPEVSGEVAEKQAGPVVGESYDDLFNALQRIDTAAVALPSFEIRHEGGLDAVVRNIVEAIERCSVPPSESNQNMYEFVTRITEQIPEKPDYWSSCGQCERNINDAQDLIESFTDYQQSSVDNEDRYNNLRKQLLL